MRVVNYKVFESKRLEVVGTELDRLYPIPEYECRLVQCGKLILLLQ